MFETKIGNYGVIAGKVTFVKPYNKEGKSGVSVTFKEKDKETVIFFKDTEKTNFTSRFEKAGVKAGSKIACYVGAPNEKDGKISYTGFDFSYAGKLFTLKSEDGSATTVFFGNIGEVPEATEEDNRIVIGGAVNAFEDGQKVTKWINFTFWNNKEGAQNATNALKVLKKGDTVAIVASEPTEFKAKSGKINDYAKVYRFTKIFD